MPGAEPVSSLACQIQDPFRKEKAAERHCLGAYIRRMTPRAALLPSRSSDIHRTEKRGVVGP